MLTVPRTNPLFAVLSCLPEWSFPSSLKAHFQCETFPDSHLLKNWLGLLYSHRTLYIISFWDTDNKITMMQICTVALPGVSFENKGIGTTEMFEWVKCEQWSSMYLCKPWGESKGGRSFELVLNLRSWTQLPISSLLYKQLLRTCSVQDSLLSVLQS